MVQKIVDPTRIPVPGGKIIEEFVGRVNTRRSTLSVAHMVAPARWSEPYQRPEFEEVTIVVRGTIRVDHQGGPTDVGPGEVVHVGAGERICYSNPFDEEAEYWAICVPAFDPGTVHREVG